MNIPEIIDAEVSGYCDLETGECITADPITPDDKIVSENVGDSGQVLLRADSDNH
jgi:hypothetical protein